MFDVPAEFETALAQRHVLAMHAFVDSLIWTNFFELAPVAVIVVFLAHLFVDELVFEHVLLLSDLANDVRGLFVPAEWTFDYSIVFEFVFGPLAETV